ncbi:MAG: sodium:proton antiporter [Phycisphaerae bacterium]|nr:sodium:proton antiporter [Phycisphaerae bacterium]
MLEHPIEHAVGIYIGLLLLACVVAIAAKLITHLPYTIFLTVVGLVVGLLRWGPAPEEAGFGHELIFFVFLPPLLFHGAFHMELNRLLSHLGPILCFAVPGVIVSTVVVGGVVWWQGGIASVLVALLFGSLISPTDPVSVLALFREARAPEDLRVLVEGESLLNDATGVVLFTILLEAVVRGGGLSFGAAALAFVKVSAGGLVLGGVLGLAAFALLRRLEDHLLENAICLALAYGAFWLAEVLHVSGVIATVIAGLLIGNYGRRFSMSERTRETVESFFGSIDFLLNSLLFILIGLELREVPDAIPVNPWRLVIVAIVAMLAGRAVVAYPFYWALNQVGQRRPESWKHILFWGGLRGSIPIALLLHLPTPPTVPPDSPLVVLRPALLLAGFGCVFFSLVVQGVTMRPLLRRLRIGNEAT